MKYVLHQMLFLFHVLVHSTDVPESNHTFRTLFVAVGLQSSTGLRFTNTLYKLLWVPYSDTIQCFLLSRSNFLYFDM